jgi:hypothetical protein
MKFIVTHAVNGFIVRTIRPAFNDIYSGRIPESNTLHVFKTLGEVYWYFEHVCNEQTKKPPESKL